ncbi:ATPase [Flavobacteriales bacterium 34_180_T64]|nr:ATPase [Flavobacteriales bacterium 34_180_T64]
MKVSELPVIVEQSFEVTVDKVWKAITELKQMTQWYFENIPEFKTEVGFSTRFNVNAPSRDFLHIWTITEVIQNRRITYNWNYEGLDGDAIVSFELFQKKNNTNLVLSMEIIEDFDDSIPEFTRESCLTGWDYFIKERLTSYLNND